MQLWYFLLGVAVSIPFNILANLLTPSIERRLRDRALSTRGRKLASLAADYPRVATLHSDVIAHSTEVARQMAWLVCWGILGVNGMVLCAMAMQAKTQVLVGGTVDMPLRVVAVLCWLITALSFVRFGTHLFRLQRDLRQVGEFEEFAKVTLEAIEGLKAENPELTPPADGTAIHLQGGEQRKE